MKESSNPPSPNWIESLLEPGFNLPEDKDFYSQSVPMSYAQFLELSERHLPAYNSSVAAQQARLERKFDEPFVLFET